MRIELLWRGLEADLSVGHPGVVGWLLRLTLPRPSYPLFVAVEPESGRRAVLLRIPQSVVPPRRRWPQCSGLEAVAVLIGDQMHFGVILKESRFSDVFVALAEDLVRRIGDAKDAAGQLGVFLGQLSRWQKFLAAPKDGLGSEAQRGLWGELHYLRTHLLPIVGCKSIAGWKGGEGAHQDFQFESGAVEVKTTLAKQPQLIRIASERQLDSADWGVLLLHVVTLEMREGGGETLPRLVEALRVGLARDSGAAEMFEEALLSYGYLDAHAGHYSESGYIVRSESTFHVRRGFPRLVEKNLPSGIGDVNYGLSIASLEAFFIEPSAAIARLIPPTTPPRSRR